MQNQNKLANELLFCEQTIKTVSNYFSLPNDFVTNTTRKREYVYARQICMTIIHKNTSLTLKKIGEYFKKDHATVLHSSKTIQDLCFTSKNIKSEFNDLEKLIIFRMNILTEKKSEGKNFYYINFDNYTSIRFNDNKGIILTGFSENEIESLITKLQEDSFDKRKHEKTGHYILEKQTQYDSRDQTGINS